MFNKLIFFATALNLALVGGFWWSKHRSEPPKSPIQPDAGIAEVFTLKENLEFAALADENQQWQAGKTQQPQLVLRFSYRNCDQCKISAFYLLEKLKQKVDPKRIATLGTFLNERDFQVFKSTEKRFTHEFAAVPPAHFGLHLEDSADYPFFFMLHPDGRITHVFVPVKEDVPRSLRYLDLIYQKFFAPQTRVQVQTQSKNHPS